MFAAHASFKQAEKVALHLSEERRDLVSKYVEEITSELDQLDVTKTIPAFFAFLELSERLSI